MMEPAVIVQSKDAMANELLELRQELRTQRAEMNYRCEKLEAEIQKTRDDGETKLKEAQEIFTNKLQLEKYLCDAEIEQVKAEALAERKEAESELKEEVQKIKETVQSLEAVVEMFQKKSEDKMSEKLHGLGEDLKAVLQCQAETIVRSRLLRVTGGVLDEVENMLQEKGVLDTQKMSANLSGIRVQVQELSQSLLSEQDRMNQVQARQDLVEKKMDDVRLATDALRGEMESGQTILGGHLSDVRKEMKASTRPASDETQSPDGAGFSDSRVSKVSFAVGECADSLDLAGNRGVNHSHFVDGRSEPVPTWVPSSQSTPAKGVGPEKAGQEFFSFQGEQATQGESSLGSPPISPPTRFFGGIECQLDFFSGEGKTSLDDYLCHFDAVRLANGWRDSLAGIRLATALRGKALAVLGDMPPSTRMSLSALKDQLRKRLCPEPHEARVQADFLERVLLVGESPSDFVNVLRKLVRKAYPDGNVALWEYLVKRRFLVGLQDPGLCAQLSMGKYEKVDDMVVAADNYLSCMRSQMGQGELTMGVSPAGGQTANFGSMVMKELRELRREMRGNSPVRTQNRVTNSGNTPYTCWGCGSANHLFRNCPDTVCHNCGGNGHTARSCRRGNNQRGNGNQGGPAHPLGEGASGGGPRG